MTYCKYCGHKKEEHTIGIHDLHHYTTWDECNVAIKKGIATYVCNCQHYSETKSEAKGKEAKA